MALLGFFMRYVSADPSMKTEYFEYWKMSEMLIFSEITIILLLGITVNLVLICRTKTHLFSSTGGNALLLMLPPKFCS